MSRLASRMARLETALRPKHRATGTIEYHHPGGDLTNSASVPCDRRNEHGPGCVMTVTPTDSGVRFMRIIHGMAYE
jgi:hypothetical protein